MADGQHFKTQVLDRPPLEEKPSRPGAGGVLRCVDTSVLQGGAGSRIRLDDASVKVGRGDDNGVVLDVPGVSRHHARLFLEDGHWHVEDLGSTNGTRVNNSKVDRRRLEDGDTLAFARVCYKFEIDDAPREAGRATAIDLGLADQTLVMRPDERPVPERSQPLPAMPGNEQIYDSGKHRRPVVEPKTVAAGSVVWVVVAIVIAVLAGVLLLGLG